MFNTDSVGSPPGQKQTMVFNSAGDAPAIIRLDSAEGGHSGTPPLLAWAGFSSAAIRPRVLSQNHFKLSCLTLDQK